MARNGSGAYSIPSVIGAGTEILSAPHNTNYADLGNEVTNSLALDGQSVMTGQFKAANGTVSLPGIAFGSDLDSGFYRIGADNIGLALGGALVVNYATTGLSITGTLAASGGYSGTFAGSAGATFADTVTITGSAAGFVPIEMVCTDAGAGGAPNVNTWRNSASPTAGDILGVYNFNGQDSAANKQLYAYITAKIVDPTDGSEDADLYFNTIIAGVDTTIFRSSGSQFQVPGSLAVTGAIAGSAAVSGTNITASGALSGATAAGAMMADQAAQEAGSATDRIVSSGTQVYHVSAAKFWANLTGTGTATLNSPSHNMTSITDNGTGDYTFTIATDFSTAVWSGATNGRAAPGNGDGDGMIVYDRSNAPTAGTVRILSLQKGSDTRLDATLITIVGFGDI